MKRIAAFIIMLLTAVLLPHTAVRAAEQENVVLTAEKENVKIELRLPDSSEGVSTLRLRMKVEGETAKLNQNEPFTFQAGEDISSRLLETRFQAGTGYLTIYISNTGKITDKAYFELGTIAPNSIDDSEYELRFSIPDNGMELVDETGTLNDEIEIVSSAAAVKVNAVEEDPSTPGTGDGDPSDDNPSDTPGAGDEGPSDDNPSDEPGAGDEDPSDDNPSDTPGTGDEDPSDDNPSNTPGTGDEGPSDDNPSDTSGTGDEDLSDDNPSDTPGTGNNDTSDKDSSDAPGTGDEDPSDDNPSDTPGTGNNDTSDKNLSDTPNGEQDDSSKTESNTTPTGTPSDSQDGSNTTSGSTEQNAQDKNTTNNTTNNTRNNTTKTQTQSTETGDHSPIFLYLILAGISAAVIGAAVALKKNTRHR